VTHVRGAVILAAALVLAGSAGAFGVSVQHGTGEPEWAGWCALHWYACSTTGVGAVTAEGLLLHAAQRPPLSGLELSLNRLGHDSLLVVFRSPSPAGSLRVLLDGALVERMPVPTVGRWWLELTELPRRGVLRLELDAHVEHVLVEALKFPCIACPDCEPTPDRYAEGYRDGYDVGYRAGYRQGALLGFLAGAVTVALVWLLVGR